MLTGSVAVPCPVGSQISDPDASVVGEVMRAAECDARILFR